MTTTPKEQEYWNTVTKRAYRRMQNRHQRLWKYVEAYIRQHEIESVLEIGCGIAPLARAWAKTYEAIDLNPRAQAIHDDFTTMKFPDWPQFDLVLACGVVEHCRCGWKPFFNRILELEPKHAIVSFFNGVHWRNDSIAQDDRGFWKCVYNGTAIEDYLIGSPMSLGVVVLTEKDTIYILQQGEETTSWT